MRKTKSKKKFKGNVQIKEVSADGSFVVIQNKSSKKVRLSLALNTHTYNIRKATFLLKTVNCMQSNRVNTKFPGANCGWSSFQKFNVELLVTERYTLTKILSTCVFTTFDK